MVRTSYENPVYKPRNPKAPAPAVVMDSTYACIHNPFASAHELVGNNDTVIIVNGGRFGYDGDVEDETWWDLAEIDDGCLHSVWMTCVAYDKIGDHGNKRIVQYKGRDEATGFPYLEKPARGTLMAFYYHHLARMYPEGSIGITDAYRPLVYRWAMQILTALQTVHGASITYRTAGDLDSYWLREDLSLALLGFMSAEFTDDEGQYHEGLCYQGDEAIFQRFDVEEGQTSMKLDLYDWADFIWDLLTNPTLGSRARTSSEKFPPREDDNFGIFVRRCYDGEYESAADVLRDVKKYLQDQGVELDGDDIKDFDYSPFLEDPSKTDGDAVIDMPADKAEKSSVSSIEMPKSTGCRPTY